MAEINRPNLEFDVMPPAGEKQAAPHKEPRLAPDLPHEGRHWLRIGLISLLALLILLAAGFFIYRRFAKPAPPSFSDALQAPSELIETPVDSDEDGLSDEREDALGTDSTKADTDGDGLADGDEINIYASDPLLPDTDADTFDDGREVARGFSPIINTSEKASGQELQLWTERIAEFGLHEPTKIILKLKAQDAAAKKTVYTNTQFDYSIELSSLLAVREVDGASKVGIYVAGTVPDDPDVLTDPIHILTAVKTSDQTLGTWMDNQYQPAEAHFDKRPITVNGLSGFQIGIVQAGLCTGTDTLFASGNTIIILHLTCNEQAEFSDLYNQIVQSFKFQ